MGKVSVNFDAKRLSRNVDTFSDRLNRNVAAVVNYDSAWGQAYMRTEAPWTDDTGAARSGLFAIPHSFRSTHEIFLAYSVTYGIWLEVANGGKYAIITPAMRIIGNKLMNDLQYLLNRMSE